MTSRVFLIGGSYVLASAEFALGRAWMDGPDISLRTAVETAGVVVMILWVASVVSAFALGLRTGLWTLLGVPFALFWYLLFGAAFELCAMGPQTAC